MSDSECRRGERVWTEIIQFDTSDGVVDREYSEQIAADYLVTGKGRTGRVGQADSHLFDAPDLVAFATEWLESRFGASTCWSAQ